MIEKVVPDYVASHHDLAVKVNEIIDRVNELTAGALAASEVKPKVDLKKLEGQVKAEKSRKKAKETPGPGN